MEYPELSTQGDAAERASALACWQRKLKFLIYFSKTSSYILCMIVHTFDPSTWEVETDRPLWVQGQSSLQSNFRPGITTKGFCLKITKTKHVHTPQQTNSLFLFTALLVLCLYQFLHLCSRWYFLCTNFDFGVLSFLCSSFLRCFSVGTYCFLYVALTTLFNGGIVFICCNALLSFCLILIVFNSFSFRTVLFTFHNFFF